MDFKQYPSYKDSGVEWLGEVPEHWQLTKIKFLSTFVKGKNPEQLYDEKGKGMYSYLSMDYLRGKSSELFAPLTNNLTLVDDEQTLIIWDGSNAGEFVKAKQGILSSTMGAAFTKKVNKQFFWYLCLSIEPVIRKRTNGMGIPHVSGDVLKNFLVAMPNFGEQSKLAAFLDSETSRIDNLIAKQEKLIEKLEEHRKSVISHAVTKGLDPNVPMKDSDVEWLGEVPEHWSVKKFGYIFRENKIKNSGLIETNVLSLSYGRIKEKNIEDNKGLLPESFETYQIIQPNDIIFRFTDLQNDKRSLRSAISKFHGIITSAYIGVRTTANAEFYNYLFRAYDQQKVFYSMGDGMRQSLKIDELNRMPIVFPSDVEQSQIVSFLDTETSRIDNLIAKQEKLIDKLKEYRTSIISYAVTGKIDVRDLVA